MIGPCKRFADHQWGPWSAYGERDAFCVTKRYRVCKVCGDEESQSRTVHSYETVEIKGVRIKRCHYCKATA